MTDTPNYGEIAERIEARNVRPFLDIPHIMALLGYETKTDHGRLGVACRKIGETHWQSCPRFNSADDFDLWVLNNRDGEINDAGRDHTNQEHYISYEEAPFGNDYGYSTRLGSAMWAAFVRLVGKVGVE